MPYAVPPAHFFLYKHTDTHVCIYTHTHTHGLFQEFSKSRCSVGRPANCIDCKSNQKYFIMYLPGRPLYEPRVFVRISWNVSILHVCIYISALLHVYLQGVSIHGHLSEHAHHDLDVQTNGLAFKALHCVLRPPLDLSSGVSFQQ